jgi:hypothetical protein
MRPNRNHSPLLNGIAWTGGVLGGLLTLIILVDVAMKLSDSAILVETPAPVADRAEAFCPLAMAASAPSNPATPDTATRSVERLATDLGSNIDRTQFKSARLTICAPIVLATFLFAGFVCASESATA